MQRWPMTRALREQQQPGDEHNMYPVRWTVDSHRWNANWRALLGPPSRVRQYSRADRVEFMTERCGIVCTRMPRWDSLRLVTVGHGGQLYISPPPVEDLPRRLLVTGAQNIRECTIRIANSQSQLRWLNWPRTVLKYVRNFNDCLSKIACVCWQFSIRRKINRDGLARTSMVNANSLYSTFSSFFIYFNFFQNRVRICNRIQKIVLRLKFQ